MARTVEAQAPSLETIFETIHGFQRSAALKTAVELDVFTAVAEGADTPAALALRAGTSERGMRILCDYLAVIGLLGKAGARYQLPPDSAMFLNKRSPAYMGSALEFLLSPPQVQGFGDLSSAVRSGGRIADQGVLAPEHPIWVTFARAMVPLTGFPAALLADLLTSDGAAPAKVLDIAAGHGLYGIALAKRHPAAAVVAVDWPGVLEVALENARIAGLANRFRTISGDAFTVDFGNDYDLVLLVHFLHHFDPDKVGKVLRKVHSALGESGRVAILEFVPNEDRISPRIPAMFSMFMLATTPSGDAYTYSEYERFLRDAGFSSSELHDLPPTFFRVIVARRWGRPPE